MEDHGAFSALALASRRLGGVVHPLSSPALDQIGPRGDAAKCRWLTRAASVHQPVGWPVQSSLGFPALVPLRLLLVKVVASVFDKGS